jgi:para-nitrobenzyl esterase
VEAFKGIPYAAPPVGPLRWQKPRPAAAWSGVKQAFEYGSPCLQTRHFDADEEVMGSEDCLTLNVWRPAGAAQNLPVMVFVHGGAFSWGSGRGDDLSNVDLYDGGYLAAHGPAIVVTFNYRLGAFGFLAHPALRDGGASGNYGLYDQIAALEWVKKNIAGFGGDPARTMIFGESAGGFSVLGLVTSPFTAGLFSRALVESGSDIRDTRERAEKVGEDFAAAANCTAARDRGRCLMGLGAAEIMRIEKRFLHGKGAQLVFAPHIDGQLVPASPLALLAEGRYQRVPLILGTNEDEMSTLSVPYLKQKLFITRRDYLALVNEAFGPETGAKIAAFYDEAAPGSSPYQSLKDVFSDSVFHCPTLGVAHAAAGYTPGQVWRYLFTHTSHLDPFKFFGAGHGMELSYVFHNFKKGLFEAPTAGELRLSEQMVAFWTRFAASGNPNAPGKEIWPGYDPARDNFLKLDVTPGVGEAFRAPFCRFWAELGAATPAFYTAP